MSEHFVCSVCGSEHAGLPTDWGYSLPDSVWAIPQPQRSEQAKFTSDLCQFGERYFIRGLLQMPFLENDGYFGWGVWAEVEWPVFERYLELYDEDATAEPIHEGALANAIPNYEESIGAPVMVEFQDPKTRPYLRLLPSDHSKLAREQRDGISGGRYHEILEQIAKPS